MFPPPRRPATAVLLVNPDAGGGREPAALEALLSRHGLTVQRTLDERDDAWRTAVDDLPDADVVVVAGGDGTVGRVAPALAARGRTAALLPCGTANNLARSLGLGDDHEAQVAGWRLDRVRRLDVGEARGAFGTRTFVEAVGIGPVAAMLESHARGSAAGAPRRTGAAKLAWGRRELAACVAAARGGPWRARVDGRALALDDADDPVLLVAACLSPCLGPRVRLGSTIEPGDGRLHLVTLRASQREAARAALAAADGAAEVQLGLAAVPAAEVALAWDGAPPALFLDDALLEDAEPDGRIDLRVTAGLAVLAAE